MNGDSFSVLKYYLKTSWSTRKINENSKFYVSNDLIWYSETIGKFRNNSFVCVFSFFLFVSQIFISSKNHPFAAILALHAFGSLAVILLQ